MEEVRSVKVKREREGGKERDREIGKRGGPGKRKGV